jgi:general secretion pathway protein F
MPAVQQSSALTPRASTPRQGAPRMSGARVAVDPASPDRRRSLLRSRAADATQAVRYIATLVGAGFPLDRALGTAARVAGTPQVAAAVQAVRLRVRGGARLADAIAEHPAVFPALAAGMVRAGERGGTLASALGRLAEQMEREQALRARLLSAMLYPAIMLTVGSAALAVLLLSVLPKLASLLVDAGAAIPPSTAALIALGAFVARRWPLLLLGAGSLAAALGMVRRSDGGRRALDRLWLRVPVMRGLRRQRAAVRLGRSLAALLESGLATLPALDVAAGTLGDTAAADDVRRAREQVRAGSRLAPALGAARAFPFLFLQMVEVGEDGGRLAEMLDRAAGAAEQELERSLDRLVRLVEPTMLLVFGGAIGFVALALLRAVYGVRGDGL